MCFKHVVRLFQEFALGKGRIRNKIRNSRYARLLIFVILPIHVRHSGYSPHRWHST